MSKRLRDRILAACLILVSVAVVLVITAAVMNFTYSDRARRDAERYQAATTSAPKSSDEEVCLSLSAPVEIANCVRQQVEAERDQNQTQSDLRAQHDMAAFAHGLLWFTALTFITGAGGFVALVWTFNETRKMTRSQESAYVEFVGIGLDTHGTYGARIMFKVTNCGRTPADDISFSGRLSVFRAAPEPEVYETAAALSVLPGGTTRNIVGQISDFTEHFASLLGDLSTSGSHGRSTLTSMEEPDGPPAPKVEISGTITWHDIYGTPQTIEVWDWAELHAGGNPLWINSTRRYKETRE